MIKRMAGMFCLFFSLCGCNFPLFPDQGSSSQTATAQMAFTRTAQSVITPSAKPEKSPSGLCTYNWATESLPDQTVLLQEALQKESIAFLSAWAEAFGENCNDSDSNLGLSFSTMETDFHISVAVNDLNNKEELGNIAYEIISTILDFPHGTFPGPNPGYIGINYKSVSSELNLWFQISFIQEDIIHGMNGQELFNKLNS